MIAFYEQQQVIQFEDLKPHCIDALQQVFESDNCKIHTLILPTSNRGVPYILDYNFNRLCQSISKNKSLRKVI
jgi:hypothetical protein